MSLQGDVIRLANDNPDLREHLLPLMRETAPCQVQAAASRSVESVLGRIRDMSWRIRHDIMDAKEVLAPRRGVVGEKDIKLALNYLKNAGDLADRSADLAVGTLRALPRTAASPGKAQSMTTNLRQAVIKLANDHPEFRSHLVPILRKTARVPSKSESQRKLYELKKKHGGMTKAYYAAALKELKAGNLAPSAIVGGGYKNAKKVAIQWLEEQIAKAKKSACLCGDELAAGREHAETGKGYGMTGPDVRGKGDKPPESKGQCYYQTGDEGDRCYTTTKGGPKGPRGEKTYSPGMSPKEKWKRYEEVRWGK